MRGQGYPARMPGTPDLIARVERLCRGDLSAKVLRERVIAEVRGAIPFDGHVFVLTDPVTRVATSPLADLPTLPWSRLPELIRWRYLTPVNRWTDLQDAGTAAASLLHATGGKPELSSLWLHVQRDLGVVDTAVVPFGDRHGCWGMLDLWRLAAPFSMAELAVLGSLHRAVSPGLRTAVARTFVDAADQLRPVGAAVVVLGPDLRLKEQTAGAAQALLQLNPPDEPMAPIPAAAYNVAAALLALEAGIPVGPPWSRVHLGGTTWVTVKASRLGHDIAVSIEPSTPTERMDLFGRAHGLSARESEVLALLGTGLDTKEIASGLVLSEHTVNDHVKAVLAKTHARTRQVLLSRAHGAG
jgi:DNA-binding CsgD family transcriptional regulator